MGLFASDALPVEGAAAGSERESEADLVERARRRPEAFAALYRLHYPAIARYIRRRVGDEHIASDLVAETFMTALEHLPRYRYRGVPFRAWLYRLATSRVNRWSRRRVVQSTAPLDEAALSDVDDKDPSSALNSAVRNALLDLPPRYQSVLALFYMEGMTIEEVARTLGVSPGTIKARLARGRERLRRRLAPLEKELSR